MSALTPSSPTIVDLLIIGGGPAGLSSALTFSRLGRKCLVYDSGSYRNGNSVASHTIPGYDGANPAEWRKDIRGEIERGYEWTTVRDGRVVRLEKVGEGEGVGFESEDELGRVVKSRKVILATGIKDNLPPIPGKLRALPPSSPTSFISQVGLAAIETGPGTQDKR